MACLTYSPSSIRIDSRDYKREELLEFTTNMLHNIKKNIQGETDALPREVNPNHMLSRPTIENTLDKPEF
jgi:hypothetical protein